MTATDEEKEPKSRDKEARDLTDASNWGHVVIARQRHQVSVELSQSPKRGIPAGRYRIRGDTGNR